MNTCAKCREVKVLEEIRRFKIAKKRRKKIKKFNDDDKGEWIITL